VAYETESWPYLEAKYHGPKRTGRVRLVVIHTPEWAESSSGAEAVAAYFHDAPDGRKASANILVDNDSIVQSVLDSYQPYAAPPENDEGVHIEITGYANQTRAQWRDKYSLAALSLAADATAQYLLKFGLPGVHLTNDQLRNGLPGIVGHDQISTVYKKSDHMDPGVNFPWFRFIGYVKGAYEDRR
jgi:hypothetical protein